MSNNHRRVELHETQNYFLQKAIITKPHIKALNRKKLALARQRLGLRWPSTALALLASAQSARGLAQSKTWRTFGRFMESGGHAGLVPQKWGFVQ
jgi:hypothetical protein